MNRYLHISVAGIFCLLLSTSLLSQEAGVASYYHDGLTGFKMANGDRYNPDNFTCAHLTYPLGSILKVARKDNPAISVMVTVVDRGPYIKGRIIDLSKKAAKELDLLYHGLADVVVSLVKTPDDPALASEE